MIDRVVVVVVTVVNCSMAFAFNQLHKVCMKMTLDVTQYMVEIRQGTFLDIVSMHETHSTGAEC